MSWPSTERYLIRPAPGGLALVQELLNTRAIPPYGGDVLADEESGGHLPQPPAAALLVLSLIHI